MKTDQIKLIFVALFSVDGGVRTQITALPSTARTLSQTSITVTRSPTPNSFVQRGPASVANLGPRGVTMSAPIRAPTPPSSTAINNISNFVRGSIPGRTPSPAGSTILSPGTTWMTSGSPPVQLIRASISQSPRGRVPASSISNNTTIVSSQQQTQQIVTSQQQQQQTYVATLSTVMPPRQQTATLIYSNVTNPQQQFTTAPNQRLAVATPLIGQRPVRPIQIGAARLATTGVRVSTANLSIRGPNLPVLAPTNVLSVNALQGRTTSVNTANLAAAGLPATRIIQVQQPQSGGGASGQIINTGRLAGNLMTLHPVIMNTSTTAGAGRQATTAKVQPSLTITQVAKLGATGLSGGNTVQVSQQHQTQATISAQSGQPQIQLQSTGGPIGIVTSSQHQTMQQALSANIQQQQQQQHQAQQQITQIVGLNQAGGHQIVSITHCIFFNLSQYNQTNHIQHLLTSLIMSHSKANHWRLQHSRVRHRRSADDHLAWWFRRYQCNVRTDRPQHRSGQRSQHDHCAAHRQGDAATAGRTRPCGHFRSDGKSGPTTAATAERVPPHAFAQSVLGYHVNGADHVPADHRRILLRTDLDDELNNKRRGAIPIGCSHLNIRCSLRLFEQHERPNDVSHLCANGKQLVRRRPIVESLNRSTTTTTATIARNGCSVHQQRLLGSGSIQSAATGRQLAVPSIAANTRPIESSK